MASTTSSALDKSRTAKRSNDEQPDSPLRIARIKRGMTQGELAGLCGMHRNSIVKLENGTTREVTEETAKALAAALEVKAADLGLRVRVPAEPRSIRFRRLSAEQRELVDELLAMPPEDFAVLRETMERLRHARTRKRRSGARR